jgi:LysR family glycine cleavage system transcriptional activator
MPSRGPPSLLALRAFEAAARHLSFTEAACELHLSQAAISRHVRTLEADFGRPLFRRLYRRVELTGAGARLAAELAVGFVHIHDAVERARVGSMQRLRISVERTFAAYWLVPRLGSFTTTYPDIEIDVDSSDELGVLGRDADVAIRFLSKQARRPRGRCKRLFALEGYPVIAARKGTERHRSDKDVLTYRLLHDDDGTAWRHWFAAAGLNGYERAKHLYFDDYSLVQAALLRGQGTALSGPLYVRSQLSAKRLVRLGQTLVTFGGANANARAAFLKWMTAQADDLSRSTAVE